MCLTVDLLLLQERRMRLERLIFETGLLRAGRRDEDPLLDEQLLSKLLVRNKGVKSSSSMLIRDLSTDRANVEVDG